MTNRIRVLFTIGSLAGGGSERQLINILRHIDRSQFEPHLYLVSRSGEFLDQVPADVPVTAFSDEPPHQGLYIPGRIRRAQIAHLARTLSDRRIDVVYDRTPQMTLITAPACRQTGVPRISTIVCDPARDIQANFRRFRRLKAFLLRRAYRSAIRVIANSQTLASVSRDFYGIRNDRLIAIQNGFDFNDILRLSAVEHKEAAIEVPDEAFHLVAVGRLHAQKGFSHLIQAVVELSQHRPSSRVFLSIAGRGPDEAALRECVDDCGLNDIVRFTGFLNNPYPLIRSADLFCLTSLYEGMPNVLVEAMSLGVPVLATDCPHGPREILLDGELGSLVEANNPKAIADGIEQAMQQRADQKVRATRARESVLTRFSVESTTRELEELIREVARPHADK